MAVINMKTTRQVAHTQAVLAGALPAAGDTIQLFRLADGDNIRWHAEESDLLRVWIDCHLVTKSTVTEVGFGIEESEDGVTWTPTQLAEIIASETVLVDDVIAKAVLVDGDRWSFAFVTQAPYVRVLPYAKTGAPAGSLFEANARISTER